ncbi:uncharacterized protein [Rutidosis leptorrhynchoides]|uniref:uncharacterized protein n=1 Tax=Rutidosis leptorrhynchoides TaxID=125765 RepID=UPI003A9A319B
MLSWGVTKGRWKHSQHESIVVNVYGPHDDAGKVKMWVDLESLMRGIDSNWLLCGEFNEVREEEERFNSVFISSRANKFNSFIKDNGLVEIPLGGRKFTRVCDNGFKLSKLDRFLASKNFLNLWSDLSAIVLDRKFSDHCPIVLRDKVIDFGPKPFRFFDEWLNVDEANEIMKKAWGEEVNGGRKDCVFRNKLKNVKAALKTWNKSTYCNLDQEITDLRSKVNEWELLAESRSLRDDERRLWMETRKIWLDKENTKANLLRQKARVKWILEGNENSSYVHSVIRRRFNKNNIRGLMINGVWNENAQDIKKAIHDHFSHRFNIQPTNRPSMSDLNYPIISASQKEELEFQFTECEILESLKACANNKAGTGWL